MPPIPCAHCGNNFMKHTNDPELKLCNNCTVRENLRSPKGTKMDSSNIVEILIRFPKQTQIEVEEICINEGISFSEYFLNLHNANTYQAHPTEILFDSRSQGEKIAQEKKEAELNVQYDLPLKKGKKK